MPDIDLKAYTRKVKELEVALYTHKMLIKESKSAIQGKKPLPPTKKQVYKPAPPAYPGEPKLSSFLYVLVVLAIFSIILGIHSLINDNGGLMMLILGIIIIIYFLIHREACIKENEKSYELRKSYYNMEYEIYEKNLSKNQDEYTEELKLYKQKLNDYEKNLQSLVFKEDTTLSYLEKTLEKWYDKNIIFPKYRNLIAITMINEYLESGRCSELEGANGAYNLYEMELRQNIVIGQLSNIIGNLEQIRNNQYSLYEELTKSNRLVQDVIYELRDLNNTAKLDAYFSYVTALAETSPKIYHGITC